MNPTSWPVFHGGMLHCCVQHAVATNPAHGASTTCPDCQAVLDWDGQRWVWDAARQPETQKHA